MENLFWFWWPTYGCWPHNRLNDSYSCGRFRSNRSPGPCIKENTPIIEMVYTTLARSRTWKTSICKSEIGQIPIHNLVDILLYFDFFFKLSTALTFGNQYKGIFRQDASTSIDCETRRAGLEHLLTNCSIHIEQSEFFLHVLDVDAVNLTLPRPVSISPNTLTLARLIPYIIYFREQEINMQMHRRKGQLAD